MVLSDILIGYGIFILEILTILLIIGVIFAIIITAKGRKNNSTGELELIDLNEEFEKNNKKLRDFYLSIEEIKQESKAERKREKAKEKERKTKLKKGEKEAIKPCLYVLDFKGDIAASESAALREEISAIIQVAKADDEVLLRLESPGGVVHGYGFAASQLMRLKQKKIKLTVAVDKVAASGGYMMACVADKIIAAPFAVIGSIGVVAQIPNIHRLLKKHDVDVDVMTAGEFKRTVTILGENTQKGKEKFQQELEETHQLFKQFVLENRPCLDIDKVATGEHWFGTKALELNLINEILTSDDYILNLINEKSILKVRYITKKSFLQKLGKQSEETLSAFVERYMNKNSQDFIQ
ncbi:protease SohB [Rodentibacter caecimuris]|uniref:Protease SohB n=1 Tax=Rodentibacter caecimuris TaxID=1796644 RepID=A0ABX3KXQ0_9PAST|nr:protease SohB [Rodentibacter heylii]